MANNPYVNKVEKADGTTIMDITDTTAESGDVLSGEVFYSASGQRITGSLSLANYVTGPSSATDGHVAVFDGTFGKAIKDSGHTILTDVPANAVFTDTTYSAATQSADGLMSATDKTKLDGVATGATANVVVDNLTSTSTTDALSANQGKVLNDKMVIRGEYTNPDMNTILTAGLYGIQGGSATNTPSGASKYGQLLVIEYRRSSNNYYSQLYFDHSLDIYYRMSTTANAGSWSTWEKINGKLNGKMVAINSSYTFANLKEESASTQPIFFTNWTDTTNFPTQYGSGVKLYAADGSSDVLYYINNQGKMWIRYIYEPSSVDTGWKEIITSGNIGSQSVSYATSAGSATDSTKVAKTGDTMTGGLTISGANLTVNKGYFAGTATSSTADSSLFNNGALEIREAGRVGSAQSSAKYAPRIGFHWSNRTGQSLALHSDGKFYFVKQDGTSKATVVANIESDTSDYSSQLAAGQSGTTLVDAYLKKNGNVIVMSCCLKNSSTSASKTISAYNPLVKFPSSIGKPSQHIYCVGRHSDNSTKDLYVSKYSVDGDSTKGQVLFADTLTLPASGWVKFSVTWIV